MTKTIRSTGHAALCEALINARKASGLTQAGMAERLKCHQSLIARIESGERRIDVVELVVLTRAIGVSPSVILEQVAGATEPDHRI